MKKRTVFESLSKITIGALAVAGVLSTPVNCSAEKSGDADTEHADKNCSGEMKCSADAGCAGEKPPADEKIAPPDDKKAKDGVKEDSGDMKCSGDMGCSGEK